VLDHFSEPSNGFSAACDGFSLAADDFSPATSVLPRGCIENIFHVLELFLGMALQMSHTLF